MPKAVVLVVKFIINFVINFVIKRGLFVLLLAGCTHVRPYERESLTHPGMDLQREALANEFETHVREAREGATAGTSESTGGGCGCN